MHNAYDDKWFSIESHSESSFVDYSPCTSLRVICAMSSARKSVPSGSTFQNQQELSEVDFVIDFLYEAISS